MRKTLARLKFGFALVIAMPVAAQKIPMTPIDLLEVPGLSDPRLSPDGKEVLFVLAEADWKANDRVSHIWRAGVDGENRVQLTRGPKDESSPRWSPDGAWIVFVAEREKVAALSRLDLENPVRVSAFVELVGRLSLQEPEIPVGE